MLTFVGPGPVSIAPWISTRAQTSRYVVSGVTRDNANNPLGGCVVQLYETVSNLFRGATISDASGNYNIEIAGDRTITLFAVAYLAGNTDISGTTINTLTAM